MSDISMNANKSHKTSNSTEEKVANIENVKSSKINKKIILYPLAILIIIVVLYNYF